MEGNNLYCISSDDRWTIGPLKEMSQDGWERLKRRAEVYFVGNNVSDAQAKRAKFLYLCGDDMLDLYETLEKKKVVIDPEDKEKEQKEKERPYQELLLTLDAHFEKQRSAKFEIYVLRQMKQDNNESVEMFVTRLRKQALKCSFSDDRVNEEVLQMLISGTSSQTLREKLLIDDNMTLQQAIDAGKRLEAAKERAKIFSPDSSVARVKVERSKSGPCYGCGRFGHKKFDPKCPAREAECHSCHEVGHYKRLCRKFKADLEQRKSNDLKKQPSDKRRLPRDTKEEPDTKRKHAHLAQSKQE